MNHKHRFAVMLISAAVTIGILFATLGKPWYMNHSNHCHSIEKVNTPGTK